MRGGVLHEHRFSSVREPLTDERDMRDPQKLGTELLSKALRGMAASHYGRPVTLSEVYDFGIERGYLLVENYDPTPPDHSVHYRRELEERAAQGDRFAQALLDGDSLAEDPVD